MPSLQPDAQFFEKSTTAQPDGSLVVEFVCPQPGEGVDGGPFYITLTPDEVAAIDFSLKPAALDAAVRAILQPKLDALAATMRPPVELAAMVHELLNAYEPVTVVEAAKEAKAVVDDSGAVAVLAADAAIDDEGKHAGKEVHDVVIPAVTTGGEYRAKGFVA